MLDNLLEIVMIGITGFVFCNILLDNGMVFDKYRYFIEREFEESKPKLYKVLGGCSLCFTGQLCLWYYITVYGLHLDYMGLFFKMVFLISASILTVYTINKIDDKF